MCTPPFPATVYPPHTPMKDSLPVLLVCRGTEKRTKHGESITYPEQLRRLKLAEYLNQTSVCKEYRMMFFALRACACVLMRDYLND